MLMCDHFSPCHILFFALLDFEHFHLNDHTCNNTSLKSNNNKIGTQKNETLT
jgi:hypothetical protein